MRILYLLLFVLILTTGTAQVQLGPCINSGALPAGGDSIQPYVAWIDTTQQFMSSGFQVGQTVDDFVLYDNNSNPWQLSQMLATGKPVLLVSGSYSCPAYRYCMSQVIPDIVAIFDTTVIYLVVYEMEAHPVGPDFSPYSDTVFTTSQNYTDGILLPQHRIYADRKNRAVQSEAALGQICPIAMDGPGNEFWSTYGPAPNNAYLITPDGWVFSKYGWMMNSKYICISDINMLLFTAGVQSQQGNAALIAPMANVGNDVTLHSTTNTAIRVSVYSSAGQKLLDESIAPLGELEAGPAMPARGMYYIALSADDRSQIITFVKTE